MKKGMIGVLAAAALLGPLCTGCAYSGVAAAGDKAVVARNDGFLFGLLRKVSVCKVTDSGLTNCQDSESP